MTLIMSWSIETPNERYFIVVVDVIVKNEIQRNSSFYNEHESPLNWEIQ